VVQEPLLPKVGPIINASGCAESHHIQNHLKNSEEAYVTQRILGKKRNISAPVLPEIGWAGGQWIEFEVPHDVGFQSTSGAKLRTRAKRERRSRTWVSDWEPAFRARCKGLSLANEIIREGLRDIGGADINVEQTSEVLPRPALIAEGAGWTVLNAGCSNLIEPDPTSRRLSDYELLQFRLPASTTELWGKCDFAGDAYFHEPVRRPYPTNSVP
jgi:hypothetical protein